MTNPTVGIIGGGQLGSLLAKAAKKINIKTIIFCDDVNSPAKNFSDEFICGNYNNDSKIDEFVNKKFDSLLKLHQLILNLLLALLLLQALQ